MFEPDWNSNEMKYFDDNHEGEMIKDMARGLSMNEICEFFGTTMKELEVGSEDLKYLKYWYKQGRAVGNREAVQKLFKQMDQRGGGQVALSYLARFAEDWTKEIEADGEAKGHKTFRVVLD